MNMKTSEKGLDFLVKHEGKINYGYLCQAKKETIGVGCRIDLLTDSDRDALIKLPLSKIQQHKSTKPYADKKGLVYYADDNLVYRMLANRLKDFENVVNNTITVDISQYQFDALVSFAFNIGEGAFAKCTAAKLINQNGDKNNIEVSIKAWNKVNKVVNQGLVNRRAAEVKLYLKGLY